MTEIKIENKEPKEDSVPPASSAGNPPAEPEKPEGEQDIDFDKELQDLEGSGAPATPPSGKTPEEEKRQAEFALASTAKRLKELGGDPASVIGATPPAPASVDTSKFVTKDDLAQQEANRLARTAGEAKVIMWYVRNKGLSVQDAHLLANKGRLTNAVSEMARTKSAVPSRGGGGPGEAPKGPDIDEPVMPDAVTLARLKQSNMIYDPAQKAFIGKKAALSWVKGRGWVNGKVIPDRR